MQRELIKNINAINNSIDELCSSINRSRDEITLIAVSKKKGGVGIVGASKSITSNTVARFLARYR